MLPQEPAAPSPQQNALSVRLLLPQLASLQAFFLRARREADQELNLQQPTKGGKAYPLGQCLEIGQRVFTLLQDWLAVRSAAPTSPPLAPEEQQGLTALREFLAAGGQLRTIWGDLRGQYFQNAMQLGALYVDVANDTVFKEKPPVEILPFEACGMRALSDFQHFATIARRYWGGALYPNHLFPPLAPWFPWISVVPGCGVQLEAGNDYMIALNRAAGFRSAQQVLEQEPAPPAALAEVIAPLCAATDWGFTPDGRAAALAGCVTLRQSPPDTAQRDQAVRQLVTINRHLARITVHKETPSA